MERPSPGEEPIRKIELGIERPEFEELLARRQRLGEWFDVPEPERGWIAIFDRMLETIPETDPELAVAAYEAIATQGSRDRREDIALRIDLLFRVDREAAIRIAARLICDVDTGLSTQTMETFMNAVEDGSLGVDEIAPLADLYLEVRERRTTEGQGNEPE